MMLSRVDLPLPLAPSMAVMLPALTLKLMLRAVVFCWKDLLIWVRVSIFRLFWVDVKRAFQAAYVAHNKAA